MTKADELEMAKARLARLRDADYRNAMSDNWYYISGRRQAMYNQIKEAEAIVEALENGISSC